MSKEYEVTSYGNGKFGVKEVATGGTFIGIIILIIIAIIAYNDTGTTVSNDPTSATQLTEKITESGVYPDTQKGIENNTVQLEKVIADLHILGKVGPSFFYEDNIQNAYGQTFPGPYLSIWSNNKKSIDNPNNYYANIELVTNKNYKFFSGTLFINQEAHEDDTYELFLYADDVLIYRSGRINRRTQPIDLTIDINYCNVLKIEVTTPDYSYASSSTSKCIIVNPKVIN